MRTSSYFNDALFYNQNSVIDQYFEKRSAQIFTSDKATSYIDIYYQSRSKKITLEETSLDDKKRSDSQKPDPDLYWQTESAPLTPVDHEPVDHESFLYQCPPRYNGSPGIETRKLSDVNLLSQIAVESKYCFRICFIRQQHSLGRLLVTRELFEGLMRSYRVLPRFKEFILLFGSKRADNEISPPQMQFRRIPTKQRVMTGPTGTTHSFCPGFECAYGLRYVELNSRNGKDPWSIRQTAVFHQYNGYKESSTWILVAASKNAEIHLDRYVKDCEDVNSLNPFEIHLIILDTVLANWRHYVVDLTERVAVQSDRVLVASIEDADPLGNLKVEESQELKELEDQVLDVLVVLDSTSDTISSINEHYQQMSRGWKACENGADMDPIILALRAKQREVNLTRIKVQALHTKIRGTTSLLSHLLDLGNGLSLKDLGEKARVENFTMRKLTERNTKDAISLKVLTIITLIYLPATVISSFFSTQFVGQEQDGPSMKVVLLPDWWIFWAVTIPFTVGTIFIWWVFTQVQARRIPITGEKKSYSRKSLKEHLSFHRRSRHHLPKVNEA